MFTDSLLRLSPVTLSGLLTIGTNKIMKMEPITLENLCDTSKLEDIKFDDTSKLEDIKFDEDEVIKIVQDMENHNLEKNANSIKKINLQELADILQFSTHIITTNHAGMLINTFKHPKFGMATTIQASDNGALLIEHLF